MSENKQEFPYILFKIAENVYAVSCEFVMSLSQLGKVRHVPNFPEVIGGVVLFRKQVIPFLDMRKLLNIKSIDQELDEFFDLMDARRQDHINWINTLQQCLNDRVKFTLTTDPHACAFGKWYDSYDPKNTNLMFLITFARFDSPHKAVHDIGVKVNNLMEQKKYDEADKIIQATRDKELKQMMHLFDDIKEAYKDSKRQISIVLGNGKGNICVSVDEILAIEHLTEIDEALIGSVASNAQHLKGIAKRKNGSPVIVLSDGTLIKDFVGVDI